ncbi:hypothetical protein [Thermomonospora amylolytica]|uniref:hypothetical protein n=1 Tax=Thermomonospora amylolytica TaxID=1411117 RepID=UPI000E6C1092|nr:hypothetical protein [Thermomonospora amylolytica]
MPVPRQLRERCREFLGLTEEIRYIFPALLAGGGAHFVFVVTDGAITVVTTGIFSRTTPKAVWGTYPRRTRIGPVDTGAGAFFTFAGNDFELDDEYIPVVNAADAEIFARETLPEDPLPEL